MKKRKRLPVVDSAIHRRWSNLKDDAALSSLREFLKSQKASYDIKALEHSLSKLPAFSMHRKVRRHAPRPSIVLHRPYFSYCSDLVQLTSLVKWNRGYNYILLTLDQFRKFISLKPLKTKGAEEVSKAMKQALRDMSANGRYYPTHMTFDAGGEYINKRMKQLLKEKNIQWHASTTLFGSPICEAAVKNCKKYLFRYMTLKNSRTWVDIIPEIEKKMNNTRHSSHLMKPAQVGFKNADQAFSNMYRNIIKRKISNGKFSVGEKVRHAMTRGVFFKGYKPGFSSEVFRIYKKVQWHSVPVYYLESLDGSRKLDSYFIDSELSAAPDMTDELPVANKKGNDEEDTPSTLTTPDTNTTENTTGEA